MSMLRLRKYDREQNASSIYDASTALQMFWATTLAAVLWGGTSWQGQKLLSRTASCWLRLDLVGSAGRNVVGGFFQAGAPGRSNCVRM